MRHGLGRIKNQLGSRADVRKKSKHIQPPRKVIKMYGENYVGHRGSGPAFRMGQEPKHRLGCTTEVGIQRRLVLKNRQKHGPFTAWGVAILAPGIHCEKGRQKA